MPMLRAPIRRQQQMPRQNGLSTTPCPFQCHPEQREGSAVHHAPQSPLPTADASPKAARHATFVGPPSHCGIITPYAAPRRIR